LPKTNNGLAILQTLWLPEAGKPKRKTFSY